MYEIKITENGTDYEINMDATPNGKRVTVWKWDGRELVKVSQFLHPLATYWDAFYTTCGNLFGEEFNSEKVAFENDLPIISQDDFVCPFCNVIAHYEEGVYGAIMSPETLDKLNLSKWDYVCQDCYETKLTEN